MGLENNELQRPDPAGLDPVDAVLRQDQAWLPDDIDFPLWLSTLNIPVCLLSNGRMRVLKTEEEVIRDLRRTQKLARSSGVVGLRTTILSHIQPAENLSIIASIRHHIAADDQIVSASSITWNVVNLDGHWRISQMVMDNPIYDLRPGD